MEAKHETLPPTKFKAMASLPLSTVSGGELPRGKEHVGAAGWQGESSTSAHTKRGSAKTICFGRDLKAQVNIGVT